MVGMNSSGKYVSRAGEKMEHALRIFGFDPTGLTCADFGSSTGGFVDCLIQHGASKIYAVETGYGTLDWKLRTDPRVVVLERTNAMHVSLPEKVAFISIDTSWTRLENILPNAFNNLSPAEEGGRIIALVKPHYEAGHEQIRKGKLPEDLIPDVLQKVKTKVAALGFGILAETESPILGEKGKNREFLLYLGRNR